MNTTNAITLTPKHPPELPCDKGLSWWAKAAPSGFTARCQELFSHQKPASTYSTAKDVKKTRSAGLDWED
jgi:hypothetical protein